MVRSHVRPHMTDSDDEKRYGIPVGDWQKYGQAIGVIERAAHMNSLISPVGASLTIWLLERKYPNIRKKLEEHHALMSKERIG